MKNTIKVFGIIAIVAVIGFAMAACGDMEDSDSSTAGRLNISGLNSYNDWTIYCYSSNDDDDLYITAVNKNEFIYESVINGDSVTFYVWKRVGYTIDKDGLKNYGYYKSYTGNDKNIEFELTLSKDDDDTRGTVTVSFTNGKGDGVFVPNHP